MKKLCTPLITMIAMLTLISVNTRAQQTGNKEDISTLSKLNAQFIHNFMNNDTIAHNKIIHKDFVCIDSKGTITNRHDYMQEWAHGYDPSVYKHFDYTSEFIRLIGNTGL